MWSIGEIIAMQGLMNMIFEVQDLAVASPATVSRCGMVYVQPSLLGWRPVFVSWMNTLPEGVTEVHRKLIADLFDWLIPPALRIALKQVSNSSSGTRPENVFTDTLSVPPPPHCAKRHFSVTKLKYAQHPKSRTSVIEEFSLALRSQALFQCKTSTWLEAAWH